MNLNRVYSPYSLTEAVNLMSDPSITVLLDAIFPRKRGHDGPALMIDIVTGGMDISPVIGIRDPSIVAENTNEQTITVTPPRRSEKRLVLAASVAVNRMPGSYRARRAQQKVAQEQADMVAKELRTREFIASQSIQGKVVLLDAAGTEQNIAEWTIPDGQKKIGNSKLSGGSEWSNDDSDPAGDVQDQKQNIRNQVRGGVEKWVGVAGKNAMKLLRKNKALQEMAGTSRSIAKTATLADLLEIDELIPYDHQYQKADETWADMVDGDYFILVGWKPEYFVEHFTRPIQLMAQDDMRWMQNVPVEKMDDWIMFSKSWEEQDPSGRWVQVECNSLAAMQAPGASAILEVQ